MKRVSWRNSRVDQKYNRIRHPELKVELLRKYVRRNGHLPTESYMDEYGVKLGKFSRDIMKSSFTGLIKEEFLQYPTQQKFLWNKNLKDVIEFCELNGYCPNQTTKLGHWINSKRHQPEVIELRKKYPLHQRQDTDLKIELLRKYVRENGGLPPSSYIDKNGMTVGIFCADVVCGGRQGRELQEEFAKYPRRQNTLKERRILELENFCKSNSHLPYTNDALGIWARQYSKDPRVIELKRKYPKYQQYNKENKMKDRDGSELPDGINRKTDLAEGTPVYESRARFNGVYHYVGRYPTVELSVKAQNKYIHNLYYGSTGGFFKPETKQIKKESKITFFEELKNGINGNKGKENKIPTKTEKEIKMGSKKSTKHAQTSPRLEPTTNLDQFTLDPKNRDLNDDAIQELAQSIEERGFLHSMPIVVDSKFVVQDGQHRLEAAKLLRDVKKTAVVVWYTIDDNWTAKNRGVFNSMQNSWKIKDVVKAHVEVEGNENYITLDKFCCDKYHVSYAIGRELLSGSHRKKEFSDGNFKVRFEERANKVMNHIMALKPYLNKTVPINTKFVKAVSVLCQNPEYEPKQMIQSLSKHTYDTGIRANAKQYVEMMQKIYNHYQSKKVNFLRAFDKY